MIASEDAFTRNENSVAAYITQADGVIARSDFAAAKGEGFN